MSQPFPTDDDWQEGVYFGLPAERYHALPWLGSSDMKMLATRPCDFWHYSYMNPNRPPEEEPTPAKLIGTAVHDRVLYGLEYFKSRYDVVAGEIKDAVSAEGYANYIIDQGDKPTPRSKSTNVSFVRDKYGKELLSEPTYQRVLDSVDHILKNDAIRQSFQSGWPEVSIFWRTEGVPMKARIDYLKLRADIDLKSFRARDRNRQMVDMCKRDMWSMLYDCQRAHYGDGRVAMRNLVRAGRVWAAGDRPDDDWLDKCFSNPAPGWAFIFYKMDGAPEACGIQDDWEGVVHTRGRSWTRRALTNFQTYYGKFGRERWVSNEPIDTVTPEDEPLW